MKTRILSPILLSLSLAAGFAVLATAGDKPAGEKQAGSCCPSMAAVAPAGCEATNGAASAETMGCGDDVAPASNGACTRPAKAEGCGEAANGASCGEAAKAEGCGEAANGASCGDAAKAEGCGEAANGEGAKACCGADAKACCAEGAVCCAEAKNCCKAKTCCPTQGEAPAAAAAPAPASSCCGAAANPAA